uniref:B30.2/SPRY domain-containing protein n=1 Tax=Scleropages formosus TaxID=113540 RepID=A0A8C9V6X7_SCLFO
SLCFSYSVDHGGQCRIRPGLLKYSCQLTLDERLANRHLHLSEGNRKVTWSEKELDSYPDHPDRFDFWNQVLCVESLSGRSYWEVQWGGDAAEIGVTYEGIGRRGSDADCRLGYNEKSWILYCSGGRCAACHNRRETDIPVPPSSNRIGIYLDWVSGTLSFYSVSSGELTLLCRFTSTFTEPLYPAFVYYSGSSVSLCDVE